MYQVIKEDINTSIDNMLDTSHVITVVNTTIDEITVKKDTFLHLKSIAWFHDDLEQPFCIKLQGKSTKKIWVGRVG